MKLRNSNFKLTKNSHSPTIVRSLKIVAEILQIFLREILQVNVKHFTNFQKYAQHVCDVWLSRKENNVKTVHVSKPTSNSKHINF